MVWGKTGRRDGGGSWDRRDGGRGLTWDHRFVVYDLCQPGVLWVIPGEQVYGLKPRPREAQGLAGCEFRLTARALNLWPRAAVRSPRVSCNSFSGASVTALPLSS